MNSIVNDTNILQEMGHFGQLVDLIYQGATSLLAMDHLPEGLLLLDANGGVVFCNKQAKEILNQDDGIALRRTNRQRTMPELVTRDMATQMALESAITAITAPNVHAIRQVPRALSIQRLSGRAPFQLRFIPLTASGHGWRSANAMSGMVLIAQSRAETSLCAETMKTMYGISPAEARLAELLVNGDTVKEAARKLNVSANTVKTQLQEIYLKTGTNSRAKLTRILLNLAINTAN